jgi:hypothetical protein
MYDPENKYWLFPNKCYKFFEDLLTAENDFVLESTISQSILNKIQIVINKEDNTNFYVKTPFDEALIDLYRELNGYFQDETKLWCFQQEKRDAFEEKMALNEYEIKYESDKPKSMYYYIYECFIFLIFLSFKLSITRNKE